MKIEGSFIGYPHFTLVYSDCSVFHFSKIALPSSLSQKLIMSGSKVLTNASIMSSDMPEIISDGLFVSATEINFCSPFFFLKEMNQLMKDFSLNYILNCFL